MKAPWRAVPLLLSPALLAACAGTTAVGPQALLRFDVTEAAEGLEQVTRAPGEQARPSPSPDGSMLAYEADPNAGHPAVVVDALPSLEERVRVADAIEPAWLPDGTDVVFVSTSGGRRKVVRRGVRARDAVLVPAGDPEHDALWPAPAADGRLAESLIDVDIFRSLEPRSRWSFETALTLTTLDGYGFDSLYGSGIEPAFSPDATRVAWVRRARGHGQLVVASSREGGAAPVQLTHADVEHAEPSWSPDGKQIAFCAAAVGEGGALAAPANLYVVGSDGHGLEQLTEGNAFACKPSWGKGGELYFHADVGDGLHVWRLRVRAHAHDATPPNASAFHVDSRPVSAALAAKLPASSPQNTVEAQRARLPPKADCADPVTGEWRSLTYWVRWGEWYEFTLDVHRNGLGSDELVGTITSHYWAGDADDTSPPACTDSHIDAIVKMEGRGDVSREQVFFGSSSYEVERRVCGTMHGYNPDNFSGVIDASRQEFQSVNNDGDRAVNEPHVFRRIRCEDGRAPAGR